MTQESTAGDFTPVAIVGGGPVGLSLALGLARLGVRSTLLEREAATSEHSKAPGIHVRTREAFRQWGIERRVREAGVLRPSFPLHDARPGRGPLLAADFSELDDEADRPGILILEQGRTEKILLEAVRESGWCDVRFAARAVGLTQTAHGATLTIRERAAERSLDAELVVGCDGADSFVRSALDLGFDGTTYALQPMLADVRLDDRRDDLPWPRVRNQRGGLTAALRLSAGLWRIIRLERGRPRSRAVVSRQEVDRHVSQVLGPEPTELVWASRFRIHRRASPRFRVGRVLLAGDAAHVHSPVGGLGMNGGIQDAHNLAWKLALALRAGDHDRLLDSYEVERRAVIVGRVSRSTGLATRALLQAPFAVREAAFALLRTLLRMPPLRRRGLRRAAMIDLAYPCSGLLQRHARAAGERLPNPMLRTPDGADVRLHDLLPNAPVIIDVADHRGFAAHLPVDHVIQVGAGAHREPTGLLRAVLAGKDGWILVRPDTHIAWARHDLEGVGGAVRHALGLPG